MIAWSFGFVLVKVGGEGRSAGRLPVERLMAACTSVAASPRLLERLNWSTSEVCPWVLWEVIISRPGICMNCRSSGVATLFAIVEGVAPG